MYSSLSTLGRSQYPTLPLGASTSNGMWTPQYPTLARSPSAGGQSDSVFLDGPGDDPSLPPASPGRYCKDPTYSNGSQGDLETDGPNGFHHPHHLHHLHHSLPRRSHGYNHNHALPGEREIDSTVAKMNNMKCLMFCSDFSFFLRLFRVRQPGDSGSEAGSPRAAQHSASQRLQSRPPPP